MPILVVLEKRGPNRKGKLKITMLSAREREITIFFIEITSEFPFEYF